MSTFVMSGVAPQDALWNICILVILIFIGVTYACFEFFKQKNKACITNEEITGAESVLPSALSKQILSTRDKKE